MSDVKIVRSVEAKMEWVRPVVQRIEAGSAESGEGTRTDNSPPQGS